MSALFEQFPLLLPALGIVFVASLFGLVWLATSSLGSRYRGQGGTGDGVWPGGSCHGGMSTDLGGGDCGGDGGGGGGD